jgi:hypothetical protein
MTIDMKKHSLTLMMVALTASIITTQAGTAEKLELGKDRVDTAAIGSGLCVHNLFQSNMEFELPKVEGGPLEIVSANFENIRLFSVPQQNGPDIRTSFPRQYQWIGFFSEHYRQGYWDVCSPETVGDMYEIYIGRNPAASGVLNNGEMGQLSNALKAEDMKRRVEEAKVLLKANHIKAEER